MRDYGRVSPAFWTRGSGKKLRGKPMAQVVALYLFTCPASSMIGIYHLAIPTMAHEIGMSVDDAERALAEVCELGIARYDAEEELVYLPEGAKYQIGERLKLGDKRVAGVKASLAQFARHPFGVDFARRYAADFHLTAPEEEESPPAIPPPEPPLPEPMPSKPEGPSKDLPSRALPDAEPLGSQIRADQGRSEISHTLAGAHAQDHGLGNLATPEVLLAIVADYPRLELLHGNNQWAQNAGAITAQKLVRTEDAVATVQAFLLKNASCSWTNVDDLSRALGGFFAKAKEYGDAAREKERQEREREANRGKKATVRFGPGAPAPSKPAFAPLAPNERPWTPEDA